MGNSTIDDLGSSENFHPYKKIAKRAARYFVCAWFFIGGTAHFVYPSFFLSIMPPYIPAPLSMVYLSGLFELLGAVGMLTIAWRRFSGVGLIWLTCVVTLANVHMLLHPSLFPSVPMWALVLRFPLQVLLLWLIAWSSRVDEID